MGIAQTLTQLPKACESYSLFFSSLFTLEPYSKTCDYAGLDGDLCLPTPNVKANVRKYEVLVCRTKLANLSAYQQPLQLK